MSEQPNEYDGASSMHRVGEGRKAAKVGGPSKSKLLL